MGLRRLTDREQSLQMWSDDRMEKALELEEIVNHDGVSAMRDYLTRHSSCCNNDRLGRET